MQETRRLVTNKAEQFKYFLRRNTEILYNSDFHYFCNDKIGTIAIKIYFNDGTVYRNEYSYYNFLNTEDSVLANNIVEAKHGYKRIVYSRTILPWNMYKIKEVIFNPPATIVFWKDGTKTVVKAGKDDFDKEKGLAMAISKKAFGNKGNYYNEFKKWIGE